MAFKEIETQELTDIQSVGTIYEHEETGAQVLYLKNDDPNKAFTIGFKTPPYNDNGIAHILEHSVLNGSKKYPSKEPFVELIKGSLNTFVNAMTFSDKTIYPVASTNQKDFMHLVGVYLDAVFQPNLYEDPQILAQEGWHHHLEDEADDLIYKGVVYNEMKGATASPERQVYNHLSRQLYPNSVYRYESGGDPSAIPSLTQEEFIDFHEKYYHPSNSMTILYGDLDQEAVFEALEEYFNGKGRLEETVDLSFEAAVPAEQDFEDTYSITAGDDPENKDYLALGWHVAEPEDALDQYGLEVLTEILFGNNQSPLKKALLDAGIGGDIDGDTATIGYPTSFIITAKYSDAAKMELFKKVVRETLEELATQGLDQELVDAALNKITFRTKEAAISEDNPRGVLYAINALQTWLYGESPFVNLEFSTYLDQLKEHARNGYFEKMIQQKLLDNPLRVAVTLKAEPGKNDRLEEQVHKELQEYKKQLSEEAIQQITENTQALIKRQETPDNPEDLAKIPTLTKDDLSTDVPSYPLEETAFDEETSFYHADQFTSGIDYINLYVDIKDLPAEDYPLLSFTSSLMGKLATKNYDVATLQRKIDLHTGGIYGTVSTYEDKEGNLKPYFVLRGKALESSLEQLVDLMKEVLAHTVFTDTAEMLKITQRLISNFENRINYRAHVLAADRALSQVKPSAKLNELTNGIDQFNYLKSVRETLQSADASALIGQLKQMMDTLLNKNRLHVLYVGEEERVKQVKEQLQTAFSSLPSTELGRPVEIKPGAKQNEAYVTAQDVNYVGIGADARGKLHYTGATQVLATALRYNYLWNEIRVKGGAYGSLYSHQRNGNFALGSYRDPNIKNTLDVYENLPNYVKDLEIAEDELLKYIIGTISPLEQPKSAFSKGLTAFYRLQTGVTREDLIRLKEEILATDSDALSSLHEDIESVLEEGTVVVIGNKTQIENEKELFDEIFELY
ncbi:insulinase family protein [Atopococcus tabaci]|uniref:insulinase family protein n=1 Tax=Atopococcus tabaci TaxID=269774 RepID=UPI0003F5C42B|nr:insulinase family protein [Atopococcus tabaci]